MKGALIGILVVLLAVPLMVLLLFSSSANACTPTGAGTSAVKVAGLPTEAIAGYGQEQTSNAAIIMDAASQLGLDARAQVIGVMTAMGESSLRNIDYGDNAVNPDGTIADSIGLFQQQKWWGTAEERMDPATTARKFFEKLQTVAGWADLQPTIAAHRVQGNSDPNFYTKFYDPAVQVVSALGDVTLDKTTPTPQCNIAATGNYPATTGTAPGPWGGYSNGQIPQSELAPVPWVRNPIYLRTDALKSLTELNNAFTAAFGYSLSFSDGYRGFANQVQAKLTYGDGAATPGKSNHGWAMAVDIVEPNRITISYSSATYLWLKANGPAYGWVHPDWAEPDGSGPHEAWHWEFYGVQQ